MNEEKLKTEVDRIISIGRDPEIAHSNEDDLHGKLIREFCPEWVVKEVERLSDAQFPRWCA